MSSPLSRHERRKYDQSYFRNHYWVEDLPGRTGNQGLSYDDESHDKRFTLLADLLQKHFEFESFLDAGCGPGILLSKIRARTKTAIGFDVSEAAAKEFVVGNANMTDIVFVIASVEAIPFPNSTFDLVFCSDVLEHVPVPDVYKAVYELCKVTRTHLVLTINLNNPYYFHPTILPRAAWLQMFLSTGLVVHRIEQERKLQSEMQVLRPEYDFFVFKRSYK